MLEQDLHASRILLVDDEPANLRLLSDLLEQKGYTNIKSLQDSREVLPCYLDFSPDLIMLDLMMPHYTGYQVLEQLRRIIPPNSYLPILVVSADLAASARQQALAAGARDFIGKPFDLVKILLRVRNLLETRLLHLALQQQNDVLEQRVQERTAELEVARREIERSHFETLERLALAAEYRDDDTGQHTRRVGHTSALLASALGFSSGESDLMRRAAPLHDIGKIAIPDPILLKKGKLDSEEFECVKSHTVKGSKILSGSYSTLLQLAEQIAMSHHERWDGQGYPNGLLGGAIPIAGRIVSVADVFDALISRRTYKKPWPVDQAVQEICVQSGHQFDPAVVSAFMRLPHQQLCQRSSAHMTQHVTTTLALKNVAPLGRVSQIRH